MRTKYHGLKKVKVRQSWSKFNLYNLSRLKTPTAAEKTFFQQKWAAKSLTRAYHGEQVREKKWEVMFSRNLPAVVSMDARYLAQNDGSEWASGRGSGLEKKSGKKENRPQAETPYMHMTYGPLERRLDTAIWRALFSSSARQARQFVVHGFVKVNGKKMRHPGYLLNPGDMFSVDPERVLYATGARKDQPWMGDELKNLSLEESAELSEVENRGALDEVEEDEDLLEDDLQEVEEDIPNSDAQRESKERLKLTSTLIKEFLEKHKKRKDISVKRKQELRALLKETKRAMSKIRSATPEAIQAIEDQASTLMDITSQELESISTADLEDRTLTESIGQAKRVALEAAIARARENPIDDSKPYRTPWQPRDYMPAFAFIPRYLEVNQKICSAVYLRHPVARPGLAEVPTPVSQETSQLAFNWYLRRR